MHYGSVHIISPGYNECLERKQKQNKIGKERKKGNSTGGTAIAHQYTSRACTDGVRPGPDLMALRSVIAAVVEMKGGRNEKKE